MPYVIERFRGWHRGAQFCLILAILRTRFSCIKMSLVSRGRCGREIARLPRLAAVVAASFLQFDANPKSR